MGCVVQNSKQEHLVSELPTDLSVSVVLWGSLRFAGTVFRISVLLLSLMALVRGLTESRPGKAKEVKKKKLKKKKSHCVKYLNLLA